jgi:hypothetical protein
MPVPKRGETEKDYLSRCVPTRQREGNDKNVKQSAAICYSMFKTESFDKQIGTIFNEHNMAKATKDYPVPQQLKPFVNKLGKIDFSPLQHGEEVYIQWMSGGKRQKRGNFQVFFVLTEEKYNKYVNGANLELAHPVIANAPNFQHLDKFIKSKIGEKLFYMSSYYSFSFKEFVVEQYMGTDPEQDLKPNDSSNIEKGNFFIQVDSPESPDARSFGVIKDDDVYVYEYEEDDSIKSVRFRNIEKDGVKNASKIR